MSEWMNECWKGERMQAHVCHGAYDVEAKGDSEELVFSFTVSSGGGVLTVKGEQCVPYLLSFVAGTILVIMISLTFYSR